MGHDWGGVPGVGVRHLLRASKGGSPRSRRSPGPALGHVVDAQREPLRHAQSLQVDRRGRRSWYVGLFLMPGGPTLAWRVATPARRWRQLLATAERLPVDEHFPAAIGGAGWAARGQSLPAQRAAAPAAGGLARTAPRAGAADRAVGGPLHPRLLLRRRRTDRAAAEAPDRRGLALGAAQRARAGGALDQGVRLRDRGRTAADGPRVAAGRRRGAARRPARAGDRRRQRDRARDRGRARRPRRADPAGRSRPGGARARRPSRFAGRAACSATSATPTRCSGSPTRCSPPRACPTWSINNAGIAIAGPVPEDRRRGLAADRRHQPARSRPRLPAVRRGDGRSAGAGDRSSTPRRRPRSCRARGCPRTRRPRPPS